MSKDYTKFSHKEQREEAKLVEEAQKAVSDFEFQVEYDEKTETVKEPKQGVVTDCLKLNVRAEANVDSEVICVIDAATKIVVYEDESTDEFYKICLYSGIEGYCMKQFITILP